MSAPETAPAPAPVNPPAYYAPTSVTDPAARLRTANVRNEYLMWREILPSSLDYGDEDFALTLAALRLSTGYAETYIENMMAAFDTLDRLPLFHALVESLWHLDLYRLMKIEDALRKADLDNEEHVAVIDEELTAYLTPTRANQVLPGAGTIRRKINAILQALDEEIATDDVSESAAGDSFRLRIGDDGTASMEVRMDAATGVEVDAHIRAHAKATGMTLGEAHLDLLLGNAVTKVVQNVYRAHDVPDAPAYLPGAGWVDHETTERLVARTDHVRDMDKVAENSSDAYRTPDTTKAYVQGRDGTCRWPGCTRPAVDCQMDHRINHEHGGPTDPENLASLCQHHHNIKTDGRVFYLMDQITGDIVWLFEDGSWVVDLPEGPLSASSRRWVQSIRQRVDNRRRSAREKARRQKLQEEVDNRVTGQDDEPPF